MEKQLKKPKKQKNPKAKNKKKCINTKHKNK